MIKKIIGIIIGVLVLVGLVFFGYQWLEGQEFFGEEDTYEINELVDLDYNAELHEENDMLYVTIVADELSEEEALEILLHVEEQENTPVNGYVVNDQETADSLANEMPDFYTEGLFFSIYQVDDGEYQARTFESVENVEADAQAIEAWEIDAADSGVDDENLLQIYGMVDQAASEEETLAQIKGLADMTERYNDETSIEAQQYTIQRGGDVFVYHTNHEDILATQSTYRVQIETTQVSE